MVVAHSIFYTNSTRYQGALSVCLTTIVLMVAGLHCAAHGEVLARAGRQLNRTTLCKPQTTTL